MESVREGYFLYADSAATSHPKSAAVARRIAEYLQLGGTYGRGAYERAMVVSRMVERVRHQVAQRIGVADARRVVFTAGATMGLNMVLQGLDYPQGRVAVSPLEHNAVARTLHALAESREIAVEVLPTLPDGTIDVDRITPAWAARYDLVAVNHVSNVSGVVQPLSVLRSCLGDVPLLVDASQSIGHIPIDIDAWGIDWLACSAHKGLGGPTGLGVLYVGTRATLRPLICGGTGMDAGRLEMPAEVPTRYEAGTPNLVGIAGLAGALEEPVPSEHCWDDYLAFLHEVQKLEGLRVLTATKPHEGIELFSLVPERGAVSELSVRLSRDWGIEARAGLHCATMAHEFYGTLQSGALRISLSPAHRPADLEYLLKALWTCLQ